MTISKRFSAKFLKRSSKRTYKKQSSIKRSAFRMTGKCKYSMNNRQIGGTGVGYYYLNQELETPEQRKKRWEAEAVAANERRIQAAIEKTKYAQLQIKT